MNYVDLHERVKSLVGKSKEQIFEISDYIFNHPELGDEEFESSKYLAKMLETEGFDVELPYKGVETAFRAELKTGEGPKIGFLAEYDALPGYGPEKNNGHACGHNWIAATCLGAGIVLSKLKEEFQGTIVVFGTPAEETTGRKVDLAERGAFDDIDSAFQMHLYKNSNLKARALAVDAYEFDFIGRASHAAVSPEMGVNALDGVMLTFAGINYLRQQLPDDVRIHGIVTQGGEAPNIIPDRCKALFYVRAAKKAGLDKVAERVVRCAEGAALMTGAVLEVNKPENMFYDLQLNPILVERMETHMRMAGFEPLDQEDEIPGSTDMGNVSYACPTLYGNVGIADGKVLVHEEEFLDIANGDEARDRMLMTVECFVAMAMELAADSNLLAQVKNEFEKIKEEMQ